VLIGLCVIEIIVYIETEKTCITSSFDIMGLTSAGGQELEIFK
jgi:hypothetical protein